MARSRNERRLSPLLTAALFACLVLAGGRVLGQEEDDSGSRSAPALPQGVDISFGGERGSLRENPDGSVVIEGDVTITWQEVRFQADRVVLREKRYLEAVGNVLVVWGNNRIAGERMYYDLEADRGLVEEAVGEVDPDYQFRASAVEKIGDDVVRLRKATVTTCTQPVPYWSFRVSSARIRLEGYARLWNVRLKTGKVPIFYLPFVLWPAKRGRAPGLLLPEVQTSDTRGQGWTVPLFVPIGDSADITLAPTYFTEAGLGLGAEARLIPNRDGSAVFTGFFIRDQVSLERGEEPSRYRGTYQQTQKFRNGFRMVADVNVVSDFDFFNDYERELRLTSSPSVLARVEFSRNGRRTSVNVRELRREQFVTADRTLIQQTLPEVEVRGRSTQLGRSPFYVEYETSLASIQQRGPQSGKFIDADYQRLDVYPTLSAPLSPVAWLEFTPRASYRWTYWTQSNRDVDAADGEDDREIRDDDLTRGVGGIGFELVGPKLYRIFGEEGGPRYKHTIETRLGYTYSEGYERNEDVILYDDVDRFGTAGNRITYGIRSRLFAQRPRVVPPSRASGETMVLPDGSVRGATREPEDPLEDNLAPPAPPEDAPLEPVEIATLEINQSRTFDGFLARGDLDGDGENEIQKPFSDVSLIGRYNPRPKISIDLRGTYSVVFRKLDRVTLSGNLSGRDGFARFSLVHRNGLGLSRPSSATDGSWTTLVPRDDDTQIQLTGGVRFWRDKIRLNLNTTYDANPEPGQKRFPERNWTVQYSTQCCTFRLERLSRRFTQTNERNDYYFRIDLRGVGKVLSQHF